MLECNYTRDPNTNKTGSTILKEWTTPDSPKHALNYKPRGRRDRGRTRKRWQRVKRPKPWKKKMMMMTMMMLQETYTPSKRRVYNTKMNSIDNFVFCSGINSFMISECEFQCKRCKLLGSTTKILIFLGSTTKILFFFGLTTKILIFGGFNYQNINFYGFNYQNINFGGFNYQNINFLGVQLPKY
jgi:hypothetical protein